MSGDVLDLVERLVREYQLPVERVMDDDEETGARVLEGFADLLCETARVRLVAAAAAISPEAALLLGQTPWAVLMRATQEHGDGALLRAAQGYARWRREVGPVDGATGDERELAQAAWGYSLACKQAWPVEGA